MELTRGALDPATHQSPRVAPPLVGRAALELIDGDAVLAHRRSRRSRRRRHLRRRARIVGGAGSAATAGRRRARASRSRSPTPSPWTSGFRARAARSRMAIARRSRPTAWLRRPATATAMTGMSFRRRSSGSSPPIVRSIRAPDANARRGGRDSLRRDRLRHLPYARHCRAGDGGMVSAHTDLLLHDMGAALTTASASPASRRPNGAPRRLSRWRPAAAAATCMTAAPRASMRQSARMAAKQPRRFRVIWHLERRRTSRARRLRGGPLRAAASAFVLFVALCRAGERADRALRRGRADHADRNGGRLRAHRRADGARLYRAGLSRSRRMRR